MKIRTFINKELQDYWDEIHETGCSIERLKTIRRRLYRIDEPELDWSGKQAMLSIIKEILKEQKELSKTCVKKKE